MRLPARASRRCSRAISTRARRGRSGTTSTRATSTRGGLFHYLAAAAAQLGDASLSLPAPRPGSPDARRSFASSFFRALLAQLPADSVLVFDNYQNAGDAPEWNAVFHELLSVIDTSVRVLVASRSPPPAALARFCGDGRLEVLDYPSLRFDAREIRALLAHTTSRLDPAEVLSLTDGWPALVALLVSQYAPRPGVRTPMPRAHGAQPSWLHHETAFGYLAAQVVDRLDAESRELLFDLAHLPAFTLEMAAKLWSRRDTVAILARLHDEHLLVERCGETSFRVHDLLRRVVSSRARAERGEDAWSAMAIRSAEELAQDDQILAAADLLEQARAWPVLCDVIEQHAPRLAAQARLSTLASAIDRIPQPERRSRPWLLLWEAVTALGHPSMRAFSLAKVAFDEPRAR